LVDTILRWSLFAIPLSSICHFSDWLILLMMKFLLLVTLVAVALSSHVKDERMKMFSPRPIQRAKNDLPDTCNSWYANNLYIAGQTQSGLAGGNAMAREVVYFSQGVPSFLSSARIRIDLRPQTAIGVDANSTNKYDQQAGNSDVMPMVVLLVRARQGFTPSDANILFQINQRLLLQGNGQSPPAFPGNPVDLTVASGPLYQPMDDVVYARVFNANNRQGPTEYVFDWCLAQDTRWADGIRLGAGDRLFLLVTHQATSQPQQSNSGFSFFGSFNWELKQ
jgi:hypothetical protein